MEKKFFGMIFGAVLFAAAVCEADAQEVKILYSGSRGYSLVERTNLRRYVNGKYVGLTSREVRSFISPSEPPSRKFKAKGSIYEKDQWYDGNFYVMEETLRNSRSAAAGVHDSILSVFHISQEGKLTMYRDNGYPSFRSFPAYTVEKVKPGDSWRAQAERAVDPLNKGVFTKMPMEVLYTFSGEEEYKGNQVYRIKALWQTNYSATGSSWDPAGDGSLKRAGGGHKADIIVLKESGIPVLVIDSVDETFIYADDSQVNFKGTITMFTEFPPALDTQKLMTVLNRVAVVNGGSDVNGVESGDAVTSTAGRGMTGDVSTSGGGLGRTEIAVAPAGGHGMAGDVSTSGGGRGMAGDVSTSGGGRGMAGDTSTSAGGTSDSSNKIIAEETAAGIRLSIRDIKFAPDSAEVLSSEKERLDQIAEVLKAAPESQFLVEGHTASVGRPQGEQTLSQQRARRIAEELVLRGVKSSAFICRGWGGTKPVASNDTEEGRAQNRRVEITILK